MKRSIYAVITMLGLCALNPAWAGFVQISSPDSGYTGSTALLAISDTDGTNDSSLSDASLTASFSAPLSVATVPDSFLTWSDPPDSETSTPRVLIAPGSSVDISLSSGVFTFGFEAEPNLFGVDTITAVFRSGGSDVGSIALGVDGDSGARLFAATSDVAIDEVLVTAGDRFAIANLRYSTVSPAPEPGTMGLLAAAMLATGLVRKRRAL